MNHNTAERNALFHRKTLGQSEARTYPLDRKSQALNWLIMPAMEEAIFPEGHRYTPPGHDLHT